MYDLLIVGAGITAATLVASLRDRLRICVVDCRKDIAGNCFDDRADGTLIHRYGPHIFHCPSPRIVTFLSGFTQWIPYTHTVLAEIEDGGQFRSVPFPYSRETQRVLGRALTPSEIINTFFRGYSQKMWGMTWEELPASVRGRIPMDDAEQPTYYRDRFAALPKLGYTHMIANMLDGAEVILGVPPLEWTQVKARNIVYTGRPDLISVPGGKIAIGDAENLMLPFRTLDIGFSSQEWPHPAVSFHACSLKRPWTRKTCFSRMTGGASPIASRETPRKSQDHEITPFYPVEIPANLQRAKLLSERIKRLYPHLHLLGRLGSYRYLDMYQAVGQALALAKQKWGCAGA